MGNETVKLFINLKIRKYIMHFFSPPLPSSFVISSFHHFSLPSSPLPSLPSLSSLPYFPVLPYPLSSDKAARMQDPQPSFLPGEQDSSRTRRVLKTLCFVVIIRYRFRPYLQVGRRRIKLQECRILNHHFC